MKTYIELLFECLHESFPKVMRGVWSLTKTYCMFVGIPFGIWMYACSIDIGEDINILSLANNLLELEVCKTQKEAVEMVADAVNIDCHLIEVNGNRYIERITEIIPNKDKGAEPFAEKDILRCDAQNAFVTGFSDEMKSKIMSKLTKAEKEEFLHDIGMCDLISQGKISPEVNTWMEAVLAY